MKSARIACIAGSLAAALCGGVLGCGRTAPAEEEVSLPIRRSDTLYDVHFSGSSEGWVVGNAGCILRTADAGKNWKRTVVEGLPALFSVDGIEGGRGWIVGSDGTILHTHDAGNSWTAQKSPVRKHLFAVDFLDASSGWAVGHEGTILQTKDGGKTWLDRSLREDVILNDVAFAPSPPPAFAGEAGYGVVSPKRLRRGGGKRRLRHREGANKAQGLIVGEYGTILRTENGGRSWIRVRSPAETSLFGCGWLNGREVLAVGMDGQILRSGDAGKTWTALPSPTKNALFAVSLPWIVGNRGTILHTPDGGKTWRAREDRPAHYSVLRSVQGTWAVGGQGTVVSLN